MSSCICRCILGDKIPFLMSTRSVVPVYQASVLRKESFLSLVNCLGTLKSVFKAPMRFLCYVHTSVLRTCSTLKGQCTKGFVNWCEQRLSFNGEYVGSESLIRGVARIFKGGGGGGSSTDKKGQYQVWGLKSIVCSLFLFF